MRVNLHLVFCDQECRNSSSWRLPPESCSALGLPQYPQCGHQSGQRRSRWCSSSEQSSPDACRKCRTCQRCSSHWKQGKLKHEQYHIVLIKSFLCLCKSMGTSITFWATDHTKVINRTFLIRAILLNSSNYKWGISIKEGTSNRDNTV